MRLLKTQKISKNLVKIGKNPGKIRVSARHLVKICVSQVLGPNSKRRICKDRAPRVRISQGLAVIPICTYVSHKANKKVMLC